MSNFIGTGFDLTIPIGEEVSNIVDAQHVYGDAVALTLYAPATLDADESYTFDVFYKNEPVATDDYWTLNNGITDVTAPEAGKAVTYPTPPVSGFRIRCSAPVAAARVFKMTKQFPAYSKY